MTLSQVPTVPTFLRYIVISYGYNQNQIRLATFNVRNFLGFGGCGGKQYRLI